MSSSSGVMSDSISSTSSEPRMLERRISNQRSELSSDQQMNYLLAWFNTWSTLQKDDFIPVLAEKLSSKWAAANGLGDALNSLTLENNRPPSLFQCQVKIILYHFHLIKLLVTSAVRQFFDFYTTNLKYLY